VTLLSAIALNPHDAVGSCARLPDLAERVVDAVLAGAAAGPNGR
jgi:hypothetical protein